MEKRGQNGNAYVMLLSYFLAIHRGCIFFFIIYEIWIKYPYICPEHICNSSPPQNVWMLTFLPPSSKTPTYPENIFVLSSALHHVDFAQLVLHRQDSSALQFLQSPKQLSLLLKQLDKSCNSQGCPQNLCIIQFLLYRFIEIFLHSQV